MSNYDAQAVQKSINSSRQKIGGRQAKLIHQLLKGRAPLPAAVAPKRYFIQCSVSDGVTGSRSAPVKNADGAIRCFDSYEGAFEAVQTAYASLSRYSSCSIHYSVWEVSR